MRSNSLVLASWVATLSLGCASQPEVRETAGSERQAKSKHHGWGSGQVSSDENAMGMEMSVGVLDERAVDRAIKPHEQAMSTCFSRAGDARKYLSGQVVMRFVVSADGQVSDVQVIRNALGSYPVERCLVSEGKRIVFPPPEGRRGTDFEYSMEFRSTGERSVIPWSGEEMARHLFSVSSEMAHCGSLGSQDVDVIAYVEAGGLVGSVGFASQGSIDPEVAACTASLMRKVHISDAPTARSSIVLRATFPMTLAFGRSGADSQHKTAKHSKRRQ
jgi:hypothetical protein